MTSPCWGFSLAVSGMMMPPGVRSSSSIRRTTTRSCNGRNFIVEPPPLLLNQMFSAERKPAGASRTDALTQLVSTFKAGVLGSLVGLKLLILRWYQIDATRRRKIDFHIPKTLTKAGSPYASHSLFAPARGILPDHGRNPVST